MSSKVGLVQEARTRTRKLPEKIIKQIGDYVEMSEGAIAPRV